MKLGTGKSHVPNIDLDALRCGLCEQARNRIGAERGLEGEILAFGDSPLQQFHALVPGCAVGVHLSQRWVGGHQLTGNLIGVVVFAPVFAKGRATYAALARAIDACDDVNARLSKRSHVKA